MHIGLIGGIGPAATDFYYRRLIAQHASRAMPLELTIVHADTPTLLRNLANDDVGGQVAIYQRLTHRLAAAAADCVVVTSIAGHFCIAAFEAVSPLPVINLIAEVNQAIAERGLSRIGILGTRTVMESRLYGSVSRAEIIPPAGRELDDVHEAYVTMAASGFATDAQRAVFDAAARRMLEQARVEAIMLGGTDLALVYREADAPFPLIDCASIHVDAIVRRALPPGRIATPGSAVP
jgi:aspartate racemase